MKSEKLNFLSDGFSVKKPTADSLVGWHQQLKDNKPISHISRLNPPFG
ncbi:MAG: hypothetical protein V7K90_31570 [Nostoc sp.]